MGYENMSNFVNWVLDRLKERSTWLGITGLVSAVGVALSPEQVETIAVAGTAVAAAIYTFTKDK